MPTGRSLTSKGDSLPGVPKSSYGEEKGGILPAHPQATDRAPVTAITDSTASSGNPPLALCARQLVEVVRHCRTLLTSIKTHPPCPTFSYPADTGPKDLVVFNDKFIRAISKLGACGRATAAGGAACQGTAVQMMREGGSLDTLELPCALPSTHTPPTEQHVSGEETVNHFFSHPELQAAAIRPLGIETSPPAQLEGLMWQTGGGSASNPAPFPP